MTIQSSWIEIACDESGFSGSNLLDPASPVITHASVDLTVSLESLSFYLARGEAAAETPARGSH